MGARTILVVAIGLLVWGCKGCAPGPHTRSAEPSGRTTVPSRSGAVAGKHVDLQVVGVAVGEQAPANQGPPWCVSMLLSVRPERQSITMSGTILRMVDQNGADLLKNPPQGGAAEPTAGVLRGYSGAAKAESDEWDLVQLVGARRPTAGARWVDVEANLRVVTGKTLAEIAAVETPLQDGAQFQVGPVKMEIRRGEAAEKALGWSKDDSSAWGGSSPGFFLVARKTDWERLGYLEMKSGQTFCDSYHPLDEGHAAGGDLWAARVMAQGPLGDGLQISGGCYWKGVEEEVVPVRLRVGVPPQDVEPGGGTVEPTDLVPWPWRMADHTPRLNGAGTDVMVEATDVKKPWEEHGFHGELPPQSFWVPLEVRSRAGRAIIGLDAKVTHLYDDAGTDLLHVSPETGVFLSFYTDTNKGIRVVAGRGPDGNLLPVGTGTLGPLTLMVYVSTWPADSAKRIRLEGELTVFTARQSEPAEAKVDLKNRYQDVRIGGRDCGFSRRNTRTLEFYPCREARDIEDLQVLAPNRRPLPAQEIGRTAMGGKEVRVEADGLPDHVILTARVWRGIERVRVPLRLEWANRWTPTDHLVWETADPQAGSDLRVDVRRWTLKPYGWDEDRLQIQLGVRSVKGPVKVRRVCWIRAVDDRGADLLGGPIEDIGTSRQVGLTDVEPWPPKEFPVITLTAGWPPSTGAKAVQLEAWLDVGLEDAPRWVPFRVLIPVGAETP